MAKAKRGSKTQSKKKPANKTATKKPRERKPKKS